MLSVDQMVNLLAAANVGVVGKSLFAHKMPAEVQRGVLALNPLTGDDIDYELPNYRRARFQIIARAPSPNEAIALALSAAEVLTWLRPKTVAASGNFRAVTVRYCRPLHDPIVYPRSEGNIIEASVNFEVVYIQS